MGIEKENVCFVESLKAWISLRGCWLGQMPGLRVHISSLLGRQEFLNKESYTCPMYAYLCSYHVC